MAFNVHLNINKRIFEFSAQSQEDALNNCIIISNGLFRYDPLDIFAQQQLNAYIIYYRKLYSMLPEHSIVLISDEKVAAAIERMRKGLLEGIKKPVIPEDPAGDLIVYIREDTLYDKS